MALPRGEGPGTPRDAVEFEARPKPLSLLSQTVAALKGREEDAKDIVRGGMSVFRYDTDAASHEAVTLRVAPQAPVSTRDGLSAIAKSVLKTIVEEVPEIRDANLQYAVPTVKNRRNREPEPVNITFCETPATDKVIRELHTQDLLLVTEGEIKELKVHREVNVKIFSSTSAASADFEAHSPQLGKNAM